MNSFRKLKHRNREKKDFKIEVFNVLKKTFLENIFFREKTCSFCASDFRGENGKNFNKGTYKRKMEKIVKVYFENGRAPACSGVT